ncbi:imidazolonepropionase [Phyllobacterium sp. YR531]|uniref:imidazolonepropionase n=1 Tax=Phyllobacterium sp. YR531 TaxID=1144343 RepID=UPI00026F49C1|nr:imidazolonepropionase [Phyllobacterium sp. YR531]EJN02442.1 imidazolonepropionase [Phyllobacterium sp. YR531]
MGGNIISDNGVGFQLWRNMRLVTCEENATAIIEQAAILVKDGRIVFAGAESELPQEARTIEAVDLEGKLVTPALVDCHTHLVYGGNRAREFEMRLEGATYEEVARAGGGIVSSVKATNALSEDDLLAQSLPRLDTLLSEGISTIEIKSGYGLNIEAELKMLRVARRLATLRPVRIHTSYLAAHAVPVEYRGRPDDYITDVVLPGLNAAHREGLVDAVDGFCEGIAFSPAQISRVFDKAKALGIPVKLHAEQLSNLGGAKLAASYGALSADHLEYLDEEGAKAMAAAGTVAVLLPGAFYTLREEQAPPVRVLRDAGVHIAVATDCNPGTSPLTSLLLTMNMACTLFRLTVDEVLSGTTREAARALGILNETGTIKAGKSADFAVWNATSPAELVYRIGFNPLHARIFRGQRITQ